MDIQKIPAFRNLVTGFFNFLEKMGSWEAAPRMERNPKVRDKNNFLNYTIYKMKVAPKISEAILISN